MYGLLRPLSLPKCVSRYVPLTHQSFFSTRTLPSWSLSEKNSLTEHPARPEDAHAQAHAQLDAHAQLEAQEEAQEERGLELPDRRDPLPDRREPPERRTGTLITFT